MRMFGKMMVFCLASALLLTAATGCRSVHGNKKIKDKKVVSKIVKGKTTQAEVQKLLGNPMKKTPWGKDSAGEMWMYNYVASESRATAFIPYVNTLFGGADTENYNLDIYFTPKGIVEKIMAGSSGGSGGGIQDMDK